MNEQPHTGWAPGMLQDDHRGFSKWLANRPHSRRIAEEGAAEIRRQREGDGLGQKAEGKA